MYKKFMIFLILPILIVFLVCNIPKTNAFTGIYEDLDGQPYVSFTTPYELNYKYVSTFENENIRNTFLDSSNTFVVDSDGAFLENFITDNDDSTFFYNVHLDDDAGYFGGLFSIVKEFQVYTYRDSSSGFVGHLSGVLSSYDFLNFLQCYSIEYFTENLVDLDFSSNLNVTLSIPIDGDVNNTLTRTFNCSDSLNGSTDNYHAYVLYDRYLGVSSELSTLINDYSIDYVYFDFFVTFDIVYYEYSDNNYDSLSFHEYVVIGDSYEPSVEAYRSVFGGYVVEEVINPDFSSWLVEGVGSFMNLEIIPGWSIAVILSVMIGIPLLIYILRLFFGG